MASRHWPRSSCAVPVSHRISPRGRRLAGAASQQAAARSHRRRACAYCLLRMAARASCNKASTLAPDSTAHPAVGAVLGSAAASAGGVAELLSVPRSAGAAGGSGRFMAAVGRPQRARRPPARGLEACWPAEPPSAALPDWRRRAADQGHRGRRDREVLEYRSKAMTATRWRLLASASLLSARNRRCATAGTDAAAEPAGSPALGGDATG